MLQKTEEKLHATDKHLGLCSVYSFSLALWIFVENMFIKLCIVKLLILGGLESFVPFFFLVLERINH
jgi:hypothetical protein